MSINVPLLRKALEHITAHPEQWDQEHWAYRNACETSHCLAGHVVLMTGHEIFWDPKYTTRSGEVVSMLTAKGELISTVAAKELGLGPNQDTLFAASNTLLELWEFANDFTDGEIEIPAQLPEPQEVSE